MKTSLTMLRTKQFGWSGQMSIARAADELGYNTLWVAEDYGYDAFTQLAVYSSVTSRIGIASGVVGVFGRTPTTLAQSAVTIDSLSNGRFTLGLGTSSSVLATGWHGLSFDRALVRLRECVEIVRIAIGRERLMYHGEFFDLSAGIRMPDQPLRSSLPVYVGAITPAGVRLAAEIADGLILTFVSPEHYRAVFEPSVHEGGKSRLDTLPPLKICAYQQVVLSESKPEGRDLVRPHLARYVGAMGAPEKNYYGRLFRKYGFGEQVDRIQRLFTERQREQAQATFSDEMIDLVTVIGDHNECRRRISDLAQLGIDELALEIVVGDGSLDTFVATLSQLAT